MFSETTLGDTGFVNGIYFFNPVQEPDVLQWLDHLFGVFESSREAMRFSGEMPDQYYIQQKYRRQNEVNLESLSYRYDCFLREVEMIERHSYFLGELYLGSCELSVDCSIRGTRLNGDRFDITIDIATHQHDISDSLKEAHNELLNDILTQQIK